MVAELAREGEGYDNGNGRKALPEGWERAQGRISQDAQRPASFWKDAQQILCKAVSLRRSL